MEDFKAYILYTVQCTVQYTGISKATLTTRQLCNALVQYVYVNSYFYILQLKGQSRKGRPANYFIGYWIRGLNVSM